MKQKYLHRPGLLVDAQFTDENPPLYRYRLTVTKSNASENPKTVCAVMQNPSYARVEIADKSVQVLERVIFEHGLPEFDGVDRLIVVNQFAFIQTINFAGTEEQIGEINDITIQEAINESDIILIAWGKNNDFKNRQDDILNIIKEYEDKTILITSCHPSRVKYDGFIKQYSA